MIQGLSKKNHIRQVKQVRKTYLRLVQCMSRLLQQGREIELNSAETEMEVFNHCGVLVGTIKKASVSEEGSSM